MNIFFYFRQQETNINYYLTNQSTNGITTEKNNDILLKQLLKNITVPQQSNGSFCFFFFIRNFAEMRNKLKFSSINF